MIRQLRQRRRDDRELVAALLQTGVGRQLDVEEARVGLGEVLIRPTRRRQQRQLELVLQLVSGAGKPRPAVREADNAPTIGVAHQLKRFPEVPVYISKT